MRRLPTFFQTERGTAAFVGDLLCLSRLNTVLKQDLFADRFTQDCFD